MGFTAAQQIILVSLSSTVLLLSCLSPLSYGYDPLDPMGNITIKWDIMQDNGDIYDVKVSLFNFQLFRHMEAPGWRLSWTWPNDDVIWDMRGAEATVQGNCSRFKGNRPHSCEKEPVIVDLMPGAPYNFQFSNCCKGGVLSSFNQDPSKYVAMFQMSVGRGLLNGTGTVDNKTLEEDTSIPQNFTMGVDGYTCGPPESVPPSRFTADGGRRWTQAVRTWNITCIYSQFRASAGPKCCVSLSAFYNNTIVPCPRCSCNCRGLPGGAKCLRNGEPAPDHVLPPSHGGSTGTDDELVRCTDHMCPIRVHWHIKQNYKEYWRVKITVTNMNAVKNYSQWNLVVQHPNLNRIAQIFSFSYHPLEVHGYINDTGMFWGIQYYNEMLLQSGDTGNVQTEVLLGKERDPSKPAFFTLREGWAFPRKISFNGYDCVMPPPDDYPCLPNAVAALHPPANHLLWLLSLLLLPLLLAS